MTKVHPDEDPMNVAHVVGLETMEAEANEESAFEKRMEAQRAETETHYQETIRLIDAICRELQGDGPWYAKAFDREEYINRLPELLHPDGRGMHFQDGRAGDKKKLRISGNWPAAPDGQLVTAYHVGSEYPSIEVSRNRGALVIAKEIVRRFLPAYNTVWLKCKSWVDATVEHENITERNYRELCKAVGATPGEHLLSDRARRHLVHYLRVAATQFDESATVFLSSQMKRLVYRDAAEARELADRIEAATFVNVGAQRKREG